MDGVAMEVKFEVVLVPVSDVDRAKAFYARLGRRMDIDYVDIEAARVDLLERGFDVSEIFHDAGGVSQIAGTAGRAMVPAPERADHGSFASFASFGDPDGNGWLLQEIRTRAPGR